MTLKQAIGTLLALFPLAVGATLMAAPSGAMADQVSCVADGHGTDTCEITFPNVLAAQTTYPDLVFQRGDVITVRATGCVQTGGKGSTWKRYVNPSGDNSDRLYHGKIEIAGATNGLVRLSSVVGKTLPAASGGPLTLGYEDDDFTDNGYYSHDNGNNDQCKDQTLPNNGRADLILTIHHTLAAALPAGVRFGMCSPIDQMTERCHIDRPDVTHATETYRAITFRPGDSVLVNAGGCVQTGGAGSTWKRYVDPLGRNSDHLYHGLISIPGTSAGAVRLSSIVGKPQPVFTDGALTLGYEDDDLSDNGYWSHDDGDNDQCKNVGPAFLDITISHQGAHVSLDGLEVTQAIQDMQESVPLVAGKQTWVRAYLTGVLTSATVTGTLTVRRGGAIVAQLSPQANLTLTSGPSSLRNRRETFNGSLNFKLPPAAIGAGATAFELALKNATNGAALICDACDRAVSFTTSPDLRVRLFALTYPFGSSATVEAATSTDFNLLVSWLGRAYPVANVDHTQVTVAANATWPFTCNQANAQLSAIRGNDISNGEDSRTHYLALVSNVGGYMRGCASGVPGSPDPSTVASAPTGNPGGPFPVPVNASGDNDASFGDWYGGHELGHTFGRAHPGFCNGNSHDDGSFPYPNGQISDAQGDDTGFDVGDTIQSLPIVVLPGAARFDIMTYCNQPQWLSAYTYKAVIKRLVAENPASGSGGAGPAAPQPELFVAHSITGDFVHVVASVDLTSQTAKIEYVTPAKVALPDVTTALHAQIALLTASGQPIETRTVSLREDTDIPEGEHKTALIDAYVPNAPNLGRLQILLGAQTKDEFRASAITPSTPTQFGITPQTDSRGLARFRLLWKAPSQSGVTYTVETSKDGQTWSTLGIGLHDASLTVSEAEANSPFIRVIATTGLRSAPPVVIRGMTAH